jgi:hypothetical protein
MKESAWFEIQEAAARFGSTRLGVMPRESFLRKREKSRKLEDVCRQRRLCNSELNATEAFQIEWPRRADLFPRIRIDPLVIEAQK